MDASDCHGNRSYLVYPILFHSSPAPARPGVQTHRLGRSTLGHRRPALFPVRQDLPARPQIAALAPMAPAFPGPDLRGLRPGGCILSGGWRTHPSGMCDGLPGLSDRFGSRRNHGTAGRQPARECNLSAADQLRSHPACSQRAPSLRFRRSSRWSIRRQTWGSGNMYSSWPPVFSRCCSVPASSLGSSDIRPKNSSAP